MPRRGSKLKLIASNVRLTPEISLGHSILSIRLSRFRGPRPPPSLASGARKYITLSRRSRQLGHEIFTIPFPRPRESGFAPALPPCFRKRQLVHNTRLLGKRKGQFRLFWKFPLPRVGRQGGGRGSGEAWAAVMGPEACAGAGGADGAGSAGRGRGRGVAPGREPPSAGRKRPGALLAEGSRGVVWSGTIFRNYLCKKLPIYK